ILLVDDDYEIVETMRIALEAKGFEILIARDGKQGLDMADREGPDLVILDGMMPKLSGLLVLERLRLTHRTRVPVIMLTAYEGELHKRWAIEVGVNSFIRKPVAMGDLIKIVEDLLHPQADCHGEPPQDC
ncbi:MAG: response regulator, partial [Planctomycetota bacterium]